MVYRSVRHCPYIDTYYSTFLFSVKMIFERPKNIKQYKFSDTPYSGCSLRRRKPIYRFFYLLSYCGR